MTFVISSTSAVVTSAAGISRIIEGLNDISINDARTYTKVYAADNTDNFGITTLQGAEEADSVVFTITSLSREIAVFLNDLFDNKENVSVTILDPTTEDKKLTLQNAVCSNRVNQTTINSDAVGNLTVAFLGRWAKGLNYNSFDPTID
jgi:hypothetical protein